MSKQNISPIHMMQPCDAPAPHNERLRLAVALSLKVLSITDWRSISHDNSGDW